MNKAAFVSFLRHFLFLLVILKFINGIIHVVQSEVCLKQYILNRFVPLHWEKSVVEALDFSVEFLFTVCSGLGFLLIVISVVGFVGAVNLKTHELINFSAGMGILLISGTEFATTFFLGELSQTLNLLIIDTTTALFDSVNYIPYSVRVNRQDYVTRDGKQFIYKDGWSTIIQADPANKSYVDFLQIIMSCCGPTGRFYWTVPPPSSCCPETYAGVNCTMAVSYSGGCFHHYAKFRGCITSLQVQSILFSFISIVNGIISLYLAHIRVKYPNDEYGSNSDSSSENERGDFF